jgi:hypothetical protein
MNASSPDDKKWDAPSRAIKYCISADTSLASTGYIYGDSGTILPADHNLVHYVKKEITRSIVSKTHR